MDKYVEVFDCFMSTLLRTLDFTIIPSMHQIRATTLQGQTLHRRLLGRTAIRVVLVSRLASAHTDHCHRRSPRQMEEYEYQQAPPIAARAH